MYTAIYNIYFHPLAKFPGPRFHAIWRMPLLVDRVFGRSLGKIYRWHQEYGYYVRVAPNELSVSSPGAWTDIYGYRRNGRGGFPKDTVRFYRTDKALGNGERSIVTTDDASHSRQRRIFSHAFSDRALREQEPLLKHYTDLMVSKMRDASASGSEVDIVSFYNFVTFDTIADLTFGEPLHLLDNMDYNPWIRDIFVGIKYAAVFQAFLEYPLINKMVMSMAPKILDEKRKAHFEFCTSRVDRRVEKGLTDHPDFWSLVLKAQEQDRGLSRDEMHTNSQVLMTAGTETTATLLSGLTYYLCRNPDKMKRLVNEIRGAFTSVDDMSLKTLPRLEYLHACLEEALRIYPPVGIGLPRIVPPEGGEIDGHPLPPGQIVYFTHFAAYHSEKNFALPDEFHPERFLRGASADPRFAKDKMEAFNPFSNGPRNCLGKK